MKIPVPVLLLLSVTAQTQPVQQQLDSLLRLHYRQLAGNGGGVSVAIVKNDSFLFQKDLGSFSLTKTVPIASASKWYSGFLLMRLVHKGLLRLSDRVSSYIPSFTGDKAAITLEQCFSHTSGLPGGVEVTDELMGMRNRSYASIVDSIARIPLVAAPGTTLNYGGLSMQVAGRVCEVAAGKSWNQLFEEEVATPLGLHQTYYAGARAGFVPRIAGGVISSAADYLRLLNVIFRNGLLDGKELLTPSETALLLADHTPKAAIGYSPFTKFVMPPGFGQEAHYGVGNWVIRGDGLSVNASPGAFGFTPWIDVQNGYYGVIAVRNRFTDVMPFFWETVRLLDAQKNGKGKGRKS